jgi:hypothetical protein
MSNSQWWEDQIAGDRALRALEARRKADEGKAEEAAELRGLLAAFIDASALQGFTVTREQWARACLLCGRGGPLYAKGGDEG